MMSQILHPGSPNLLLTSLVGWFVMVNLLAFMAFFLDQRRAMAEQGPMPEMPLLLLSSVGGWLGAQLGQLCFRAQTRERAFRVFLNLSILPVLALAAMMAAQDVDWGSLAAKIPEILAAQTASPAEEVPAATDAAEPVATDAAVTAPAVTKPVVTKPVVRDTAKASAPKETSVTDNPDLPRRFGPSSKKQAWQSR